MKPTLSLSAAMLALACSVTATPAETFVLDPVHSTIGFSVRHMVISNVEGTFNKFEGAIEYVPDDPSKCSVNVTIDAASVDTRNHKRNADVKSAGILSTSHYPHIVFKSKRVSREGDRWRADGDLTIHGATRPVTLTFVINGPIKDPWGNTRMGIEVDKLTINRQDFGIQFNKTLETGGLVVGKEVAIRIQAEAVVPRKTR